MEDAVILLESRNLIQDILSRKCIPNKPSALALSHRFRNKKARGIATVAAAANLCQWQ
jgi:hypothetical protein